MSTQICFPALKAASFPECVALWLHFVVTIWAQRSEDLAEHGSQ